MLKLYNLVRLFCNQRLDSVVEIIMTYHYEVMGSNPTVQKCFFLEILKMGQKE